MAIDNKTINALIAVGAQARINATSNTDEQALQVAALYRNWETIPEGTPLETGERLNYKDVLYKVLEPGHNKQNTWPPDTSASLYTPVAAPGEGTKDNPIAWVPGMESEKDKYYTDEGVLYIGLEDSGVGLQGQPKDLPRYFEQVV